MKVYVARVNGEYAVCDDNGGRVTFMKARGYQAAIIKWAERHDIEIGKIASWIRWGKLRESEWAMSASGLRMREGEE